MDITKTPEQQPLTIVYVIDKSTGTKYRWDSPDSDYLCSLVDLPEEEFPQGQHVNIVTYKIDSLADLPELQKQLIDYGFGYPGERWTGKQS
jgi:hypothetical protein